MLLSVNNSGFHVTEKNHKNGLGKCSVTFVNEMEKEDSRTYVAAFDKENVNEVIRWNDNSVITVATNFDIIHTLSMVNRFKKKKRTQICKTNKGNRIL